MRSGHRHLLLGHNHLLHTEVTQLCISSWNLQILSPTYRYGPQISLKSAPSSEFPSPLAPAETSTSSSTSSSSIPCLPLNHILNISQVHLLWSIPIATTNAAFISCLNNYNNVFTHHFPTNLHSSLIHSQPLASTGVLKMQNCCIILVAETSQ